MTDAREQRAADVGLNLGDRRLELVGSALILLVATILRLGNLAARGTWDADQGHDMLVLRALVLDGTLPLLGPPTSIGDFHHGVLYYFLLAPVAAISRADPVAVTTWIALCGVAAVAVTGWLARSIAGPLAGLIAALLMAVSASAVEESIFIWNPNLIALSSSIALAAAWRAWQTGRTRWWVVAGSAAIVTMHCHVLGMILTPVVAGLLIADLRRRRRAGDTAGVAAVGRSALVWAALALLSYVPLAIHELGHDGSELRAAIAFITGGGGASPIALPARIPIVGLRVIGWPLAGLITDAPLATLLAAGLVSGLAVWRGWWSGAPSGVGASRERVAVRWLSLGLAWTILALAIGASSLATVVAGLPNDHYHAFADPMVFVIVAVGLRSIVEGRSKALAPLPGLARIGLAATLVVAIAGWNLVRQPPAAAADGGWSAAAGTAGRVIVAGGAGPLVLSSLPIFKSDEALRMPLVTAGAVVASTGPSGAAAAGPDATRVILCDQLFREAIGADCGGPAEDRWLADPASGLTTPGTGPTAHLVERFEAAPGRWVSIYRVGR